MTQRINITLDEQTYDILRAVSFQQKRSMSEIVRESIKKTLAPAREQAQLMLNAKDEAELLEIIENDEYSTWNSLKKRIQSS